MVPIKHHGHWKLFDLHWNFLFTLFTAISCAQHIGIINQSVDLSIHIKQLPSVWIILHWKVSVELSWNIAVYCLRNAKKHGDNSTPTKPLLIWCYFELITSAIELMISASLQNTWHFNCWHEYFQLMKHFRSNSSSIEEKCHCIDMWSEEVKRL